MRKHLNATTARTLQIEPLENRHLLATLAGSTASDSGTAPAAAFVDDSVVIRNSRYSTRYLHELADNNVTTRPNALRRSQWELAVGSDGTVLQNRATGRFLDADNSGVDTSSSVRLDDHWRIISVGERFAIQSVMTDKFLIAGNSQSRWDVAQIEAANPEDLPRSALWYVGQAPPEAEVRFTTFGDYGLTGPRADAVSGLVHSLAPDAILGTGDARHTNYTYESIHEVYCEYLANATSSEGCQSGGNSGTNRFFPALGNHDYWDEGGMSEYVDYFQLPGTGVKSWQAGVNDRYYDAILGPVHLFVLDSQAIRDSASDAAAQRAWLQAGLENSEAPWQVVVTHHAPYSSSDVHGSHEFVQWPYAEWGADIVMASHDHLYERLQRDGITYIVNGLGGRSIYSFGDPIVGSRVRYNEELGVGLFHATTDQIQVQLVNVSGEVIDSYVIEKPNTPRVVGRAFLDADADGQQDSGEAGLHNWVVFVDANDNRKRDAGERFARTDIDGTYELELAGSGRHLVRMGGRTGFQSTNATSYEVEVDSGATRVLNFGQRPITNDPEVFGSVFEDLNGNGARDHGEPGLRNWVVWIEEHGNRRREADELFVRTTHDGSFRFGDLPDSAPFSVNVAARSGYMATSSLVVAVESGRVDFGLQSGATGVAQLDFDMDRQAPTSRNKLIDEIFGSGLVNR